MTGREATGKPNARSVAGPIGPSHQRAYGRAMLNPQPHINTHEPWIWREFAHQLPLSTMPSSGAGATSPHRPSLPLPSWLPGTLVATHEAYGVALRALGADDPRVVALEGNPDGSSYVQVLPAAPAGRPCESVIANRQTAGAEQRMVAAALALQARGKLPFAATFADSWTSAHALIRIAAIEGADIRLIGSHGATPGDDDGTSEVALEDIAMFRAIHDSTVLVASDANQTGALVATMLDQPGVVYLRTLHTVTRVIYQPGQHFPIGGSRTLRTSRHDDVTLLGAGTTVHEALTAADSLAQFGINARVIDLYSVQPLDTATVLDAARETGNLIVAEDHWPTGGLGDAASGRSDSS
jgi:transketolase